MLQSPTAFHNLIFQLFRCFSGINPYSLDGGNVGVFMSLSFSEVSEHSFDDTGSICLLLGSNKTMLSNRLSFALNLKGQLCSIIIISNSTVERCACQISVVRSEFYEFPRRSRWVRIVGLGVQIRFRRIRRISHCGCIFLFQRSENQFTFYRARIIKP